MLKRLFNKYFDYVIVGDYFDLEYDDKTNRIIKRKCYIKKWYFKPLRRLLKGRRKRCKRSHYSNS